MRIERDLQSDFSKNFKPPPDLNFDAHKYTVKKLSFDTGSKLGISGEDTCVRSALVSKEDPVFLID